MLGFANNAQPNLQALKYLGGVLGIMQADPDAFFQTMSDELRVRIDELVKARNVARKEKNWVESDRIRNELSAMKVIIEDGANGTTWKIE